MDKDKIILKVIDVVDKTFDPTDTVLSTGLTLTNGRVIDHVFQFANEESRTYFLGVMDYVMPISNRDTFRRGFKHGMVVTFGVAVGVAVTGIVIGSIVEARRKKSENKGI